MGFDNECILNIQSLAGEYFCPVCRMLVYPNEALQSQCTHLYCKPCLTYIVSTTRACPYDGYLVTEADSKPLVESNAALAETICKVTVHCLFQRSGCTWQGSLLDCVSHCAGCAFGNSPVVCNRCSVQIVHRQVQEHAQVCPGVQPQTQPAQGSQVVAAAAPATAPAAAATQPPAVAVASQIQTSAAVVAAAVPPGQAAAQTSAAAASQWYQQQPQYQQYYQQYPGYDAYQQQVQQQYAQYQQPQSQAQPVPQPQNQSQPQAQPPVVTQPSSQALANTPQQTYPGAQPATHSYATPQPTSYPQAYPVQQHNLQTPQYQQSFPQMQQARPQIQTQSQYVQPYIQPLPQPLGSQTNQAQVPSVHSVTGHQAYPQVQLQQQIQPGVPQQPAPLRPLSGPHQQPQVPIQVQTQFPQQPPVLHPPQQPAVLPSAGQTVVLPTQQQAVQSYHVHPGFPPYQQSMQSVQQSVHQQYGQYQQPFSGQPSGPVQPHVNPQGSYLQPQPQPRPQGQPQTFPQNALLPQGLQPHQSLAGRPMVQPHAVPQTYAGSTFGAQVKPMQFANQHSLSKTENLGSEQKLGISSGTLSDNLSAQKNDENDVASSLGSAGELNSVKSENGLKLAENEDKSNGNSKEVQESHAADGVVQLSSTVKDEPLVGSVGGINSSENKETKDLPLLKPPQLLDAGNPEMKMEKDLQQAPGPQINNGPFGLQQRPPGPSLFQAPPPGPADHLPGFPSGHVRPLGTAHLTQPRGLEFTDGRLAPYGQQSGTHSNAMRMNGPPALNSSSTHGLHDDRFRPSADQHPFAGDPSRHRQFEEGFKHFPRPSQLDGEPALGRVPHLFSSRPLDRGHNFAADVAPRPFDMDPLGGPRPFPPHHRNSTLHPADLREHHPFAFREHNQPDFVGPGSGYLSGRMVGLAPRSPGRDFPGLSSSGFGGFPFRDDIDGRESRRFADPIDKSFRDGGFGRFPGHFPRDDFEASGIRIGDHVRTGGSIGLDGPPYHVRRGEYLGSHSLPSHLQSRDGFSALPGQLRMGGLVPETGNYHHSRFGEPGFRSSFPLKGFPSYGGNYTGETESFDGPRKRKPVAMGWCRICKVDCETVEGLDLHSQTREHQKMAMDMVLTIKQNAKKLKTDATSNTTHVDETKNANSEGHGSKH